jgi:hypothetical protein
VLAGQPDNATHLLLLLLLPNAPGSSCADFHMLLTAAICLPALHAAAAAAAANREKFLAAAASAPRDFSQVQMTTYLTASKFRQTIEKHKKALGGGLQGPQEAGESLQVRLGVCVYLQHINFEIGMGMCLWVVCVFKAHGVAAGASGGGAAPAGVCVWVGKLPLECMCTYSPWGGCKCLRRQGTACKCGWVGRWERGAESCCDSCLFVSVHVCQGCWALMEVAG